MPSDTRVVEGSYPGGTQPYQPLQLFIRQKGARDSGRASLPSSLLRQATTMQGRTAMKSRKTSTTAKAAIAIVVASLSLAAVAPVQAAGPDRGDRGERREFQAHRQGDDQFGPRRGGMRMGGRGGLLALTCGPHGAERIEHALVALKYRTNPTGDQIALFDAFKAAALGAQRHFAATCDATLPDRPVANADAATTTARPNMLEAMQMRLTLEEARVAALGDVLPSFEAYFNSLTAEQKATLDFHGRGPGRGPAPAGAPDAAGSTERPS